MKEINHKVARKLSNRGLSTILISVSLTILGLIIIQSKLSKIKNELILNESALKQADSLHDIQNIIYFIGFLFLVIAVFQLFMIFTSLSGFIKKVADFIDYSDKRQQSSDEHLSISKNKLREAEEQIIIAESFINNSIKDEEIIKSASLLEGQEQERKRMSREMHDGIGQLLTGIKLTAAKLNYVAPTDEKYPDIIKTLNNLITETIEATRVISFNLMPSVLEDNGLVPVFNILKMQSEANFGIKVNLDLNVPKGSLPKNIEVGVYRIVQEALNNTLKYAKSEIFNLTVHVLDQKLKVNISDYGVGFDLNKFNAEGQNLIHNGIVNMNTRTKLMGGEFKLVSAVNNGTQIFIVIPL